MKVCLLNSSPVEFYCKSEKVSGALTLAPLGLLPGTAGVLTAPSKSPAALNTPTPGKKVFGL